MPWARYTARRSSALTAIKEVSREALQELRSTLGVLRQVDDEAPTAPIPGLSKLAELTERTEAIGLTVRLEIEGEIGRVPSAVSLAVYRIVNTSGEDDSDARGAAHSGLTDPTAAGPSPMPS